MKHLSQGVKVGILVLFMGVGSYGLWKMLGERASGASDYQLWAHFRDASGLPEGSRIVIAGLPVGEIEKLSIDGRYARVTMRLRDVRVYENAVAMKKSSSLLGDYYIEIDPGTPFSIDAEGNRVDNELLDSGEQIERVVEATSPDALMRRIEESMPKVDQVLLSVRDLSEDVRALINGPIASMADRIDRLVAKESETIESILANLDQAMARIDTITRDVQAVTSDARGQVDDILDNIEVASAEAKQLMTTARTEVEDTGAIVREKLELVDEVLERSASVATKIDENEGTLGRLVNDSTIADNIEDITDDARGFVQTLLGMQTLVGLRSEYMWNAGEANNYVTIELHTRPDKFYLIEFNRGPRGKYPEVELVSDPIRDDGTASEFERRITIEDGTRLTFQIAKRIDWATFRFGIKEGSGGVGFDADWDFFDHHLKLSADVFDTSLDNLPRLKLSAAFEFFSRLYVLAGIDDALNEPFTVTPANPGGDFADGFPAAFDDIHFGRDYFLGGMIVFDDLDLTALLTIGSGIVVAASE